MNPTIKAIETRYKGYRFRSRLEARWAVFFDALGIKWEYEKEGYDLGKAGRYLPDFWLPECNRFIEIKPASSKRQRRIYAAGRMDKPSEYEWREDVNFRFSSFDEYIHACTSKYETSGFNGHLYVGPFAVDEFDSYHGEYGHINLDMWELNQSGISKRGWKATRSQELVSIFCRDQISRCDLFFAWLDNTDRYGTLVEIGFAKALEKEIWIGRPIRMENSDLHGYWSNSPLWFAEKMADKVAYADSALEAFSSMDTQMTSEEIKCSALSAQSQCDVSIFYGTPGSNEFSASSFANGCRCVAGGELTFASGDGLAILDVVPSGWARGNAKNMLHDAYSAAKSARFEHGETPSL